MPTITLTETEASHIRKLVKEDKDALYEWSHNYVIPEGVTSYKAVMELDEGLLRKLDG
jgi:hypothetical protein